MRGLIMDRPLLISSLLEHADRVSGDREIVSRSDEGRIHRYTYHDAHTRSRQLANALTALGVQIGDRIATVAWNTHRHLEIYFAVSGIGAITHTLNPRLHPSQLGYIANHAEDSYIFVDTNLVPLVEAVAGDLPALKGVIVMTDKANMPTAKIDNLLCYEDLIDNNSDDLVWPEFDENTASSLCYTSGTSGNPKGALYSHRSTIIHAYAAALPDVMNLSERSVVLPVVPMFHANAWGIPYSAAMTGSKLVFPGAHLDGASIHELLVAEEVTFAAGVPTVWLALLNHWRETGTRVPSLEMTVIGGSAIPQSMIEAFQEDFGVAVRHAWGMTEMSPLGSVSIVKPRLDSASNEEKYRVQIKQGRPVYGVEVRIVDDDGNLLPHDGEAFGELQVRGPWITSSYFRLDTSEAHGADGWFATGDVCTIDPDSYIEITDRAKDVIKSGGEWISSIELENVAMGHPDVLQAAVIGVAHPKWDERPLLIVVPAPGKQPTHDDLTAFLTDKVAKWWLPDDMVLVDELPLGATGKVLKTKLREQFGDHKLPTA
ncbi:MAG: 3-(methylthio)propionyl-CoA ligase [Alphaproteobacteria bacterium]|nr:3-(methylthio)propionyl-CoA ligase [Alphaproteobacteria bacterium]MCZ6511626.1 3-(methylthio)propionyl-CoA ligase [Alphaproteobacteria bacterium]MCZ6591403.1 3-(methylthio)propionyl-CoA ligase [Alphaproteobacteria bacterium]MCZ6839500.1 3-(methylthio)propionyl-CoA ligase [Alphaproteobacteria bacterium]